MSETVDGSLSAAQREILRVARENPDFSVAGVAEATGHRVPLVRDTLADHGDDISGETESSPDGTPVDSASFNGTETAVLETALRNPEATNAEIAATVDTHVGLVRDIRDQYEEEVTLPDGDREPASASSSAATGGTSSRGLSETQEAILAVADENPAATNAEIADEVGARLPLVRDTLAAHGDELTADSAAATGGSKPVDSASFNETESAVLEAALRDPEATNAEIAARVGTHVGLVRDIRAAYEDEATLPDGADAEEGAESATSSGSAGGMQFDNALLTEAQKEILDVARDHPALTNAEIAGRTGHRLPLVRDTVAEHIDDRSASTGGESAVVRPTDSASFNETESAVLETALRDPEATNAEIADEVGVHVGLVRDIREQYEDEATLASGDVAAGSATDAAADGDVAVDADLSATQQAILEAAAAQPEATNAEIADEVGAGLPLVRDTLAAYGDEIEASTQAGSSTDATGSSTDATGSSTDATATESADVDSELHREIIELAEANPEMTNAEIAAKTGARVALVRDLREEHDISVAA